MIERTALETLVQPILVIEYQVGEEINARKVNKSSLAWGTATPRA